MASPSIDLDPRIQRTHQYLREALIDLVLEIGYQQITVTRLAQKALINRSTFYLHYKDIDDLLTAGFQTYWDQVLPGVKLFIYNKPVLPADRLESILEEDLNHFDSMRDFYRVMLCDQTLISFEENLTDHLVKITRERFSPPFTFAEIPDLRLDLIHTWAASAYLGVIRKWLKAEDPESVPTLAAELTDLFLDTLQDPLKISVPGRLEWPLEADLDPERMVKI